MRSKGELRIPWLLMVAPADIADQGDIVYNAGKPVTEFESQPVDSTHSSLPIHYHALLQGTETPEGWAALPSSSKTKGISVII